MPWKQNDPFDEKRRKLAEQEKLLAEQMAQLKNEMSGSGHASGEAKAEPPVWRMEEDSFSSHRSTDPAPVRKRNLARQRQRDMMLFFILIGALLVVVTIALWVAYVRNAAPINGP
jgi:hypothetical protein